ncbi:MAG: leucine-rich repeat protein [Bacilli bacterium]|jgi:DNA modification methylase|nr:leucine-rich repeat protein [Bacilli bacterium]
MQEKEISDNRMTKDFKYLALYYAMGFKKGKGGLFTKGGLSIDSETGTALLGEITVVGSPSLRLDSHKSFVVLELVERLLTLGYDPREIIVDPDNEFDVYCGNKYIKCEEWGRDFETKTLVSPKKGTFFSILYSSRLYSGLIERKEAILNGDGLVYSHGFTDAKKTSFLPRLPECAKSENGFEIVDGAAVSYSGNPKNLIVPAGVNSIASCLFYDNQDVEEVSLPEGLVTIGGDLFYNCHNLRKANVPSTVTEMGNNPFAGCEKLVLTSDSPCFPMVEGALYSKDGRLIYYPISSKKAEYEIKDGTNVIGKHAFYLCQNLNKVTIPKSVERMENFPFSGCGELGLDIKTSAYHQESGLVYDEDFKTVVGCLKKTKSDRLEIKEDVTSIGRNSFFECGGVRTLVLPSTLKQIGYNPFVGCENITFESRSGSFVAEAGVLYNADCSKLICCPPLCAKGRFVVRESVIELERGAFAGCNGLTEITLRNVSKIGKNCFSGCSSLREALLPDWVHYVGECAFSHCPSLEKVSAFADTFFDSNAFIGSPTEVELRKARSNWLIESDNIHSLRTFQKAMVGKVSSILIDPPYDSKIGYIGYKDDYGGGYEKFMFDRISLAKNLLSDDGFMVVNIDRGGLRVMKKMLSECFGRKNVRIFLWKKLDKGFDANRDVAAKKKRVLFEYVLICLNGPKSKLKLIMQPVFHNGKQTDIEKPCPLVLKNMGTTSSAKDELAAVFGDRSHFSTPKPKRLMMELIRATTPKDGLVMDFFAGSGTVGAATWSLNQSDGGTRTFVLISNSENDICEKITRERLDYESKQSRAGFIFDGALK